MNLRPEAVVFARHFLACTIAALLVWSPRAATAGQDHVVEAGIKAWWNEWKREDPGRAEILSRGAVLVGPELTARWGGLLFLRGAVFFSPQDYEFSGQTGVRTFARRDGELAGGILVGPDLALTGGYRQMRIRENEAGLEQTLTGPVAGLTAVLRVYQGLAFHMRFEYQFTRLSQETLSGSLQEKSPGWIGELAVGYHFSRSLSGTLGYKTETNKGKDSSTRDIFSGISGGLFYSF